MFSVAKSSSPETLQAVGTVGDYQLTNHLLGYGGQGIVVECAKGGKSFACKLQSKPFHETVLEDQVMRELRYTHLLAYIETLQILDPSLTQRFSNIWRQQIPLQSMVVAEYLEGHVDLHVATHRANQVLGVTGPNGPIIMTEANALVIFYQAVKAVWYMHLRGYVHLDVKPQNIMVKPSVKYYDVRLIDFGSARKYSVSDGPASPFFASFEYMPNNNVYTVSNGQRGLLPCDLFKLDVFALGVTLFEVLYGGLPFEGINKPLVRFTDMPIEQFVAGHYVKATGALANPLTQYLLVQMLDFDEARRPYLTEDFVELVKEAMREAIAAQAQGAIAASI